MGENVGLRIHLAQGFNDLLAASHSHQPVMNDCDVHRIPLMRTLATIMVEERSLGALQAASKALHRFVQAAMPAYDPLVYDFPVWSSGASSGSQAENCGTCDDGRLPKKSSNAELWHRGSTKSIALPVGSS